MQAIILAGGFGTRLRSRIKDLPKPMAPVAGRPFLEYLLDRLDKGGCSKVVLATGHLSQVIEDHFGDRYRGLAIEYSREASPLGTGGAIVQALRLLPAQPALVLNGDTWLDLDPAAFVAWCEARPGCDAIVLRSLPDASRYGSVELAGERILRFGEKAAEGPGLINAGVYWLHLQSFQGFDLPTAFSIETDFFQPHVTELDLRGFVMDGNFIDIGVPQDYDRAQVELPRWLGK